MVSEALSLTVRALLARLGVTSVHLVSACCHSGCARLAIDSSFAVSRGSRPRLCAPVCRSSRPRIELFLEFPGHEGRGRVLLCEYLFVMARAVLSALFGVL